MKTRRALVLTSVLAVLLALAPAALAQEVEQQFLDGKLRMGDAVTVPADETVEGDLYVFSGEADVDGVVTGDLVVFAGTVSIAGTVEGDLLVAAGSLTVTGEVEGDLRLAVGQAAIQGDVGEDLLAAAGQVNVAGDVGEDLVFAAGRTDLGGTVGGDVLGRAGAYSRTGTVQGSENVTVDEPREEERPNILLRALSRFASLLLVGLLILWASRRTFQRTLASIDEAPGWVALWGLGFLAALVLVPGIVTLVGVLLAILFGWLGLGLIVGLIVAAIVLTWVLTAAVAFVVLAVLAPLTVGTWLAARVLPDRTPGYLAMAAGVAVLVLLGLIPVVGLLVSLAVTILGAGAWLRLFLSRAQTPVPVDGT